MTGTNLPMKYNIFMLLECDEYFGVRVHCLVSGTIPVTEYSLLLLCGGVCWGGCCSVGCVGGFCGGVTPGPFSNPEAKSACADGTALGRVWESRSPPALKRE